MRITLLAALLPLVNALGQKQIISFGKGPDRDTFQLAGKGPGAGQIRVSEDDYWGVIRAAGDLAVDFGRVTGRKLTLSNGERGAKAAEFKFEPVDVSDNTEYSTIGNRTFKGPEYSNPDARHTVIIAGTIGHSDIVDRLVDDGKIDVSSIEGEWEAFVTKVVKNPFPGCPEALVIAGSMARGTIYGIYDISEQIGVSPWYFWADVPTKRHSEIYVTRGKQKTQGPPSVKFRGFFLNDEQPGLTNWVSENWPDVWNDSAGYNHHFYALVAELMLRLRANYLWPTLWGSIFYTDDPYNQPMLYAYEVVLGSSHTEPLMRAQNEFRTYYEGPWAYNENNKTIDEYFRYGVERAEPYARNSVWTMAMRGTGDTAIEGLGIDVIIEMLETLVHNQREIMTEGLGLEDGEITTIPQLWCLYKEVQSYLEQGLVVPEDITLLWSDDNRGNLRRLPLSNETDREGGAGVYYHFDYVGGPRNYKWINTVDLTKTAEQMQKAYARNANRIWVVNVGDLKPLEIPISHFLDMAYDADKWTVDATEDWVHAWASREFGARQSKDIASIVNQYSILAGRRVYELVGASTYSLINYNEADTVLSQWKTLEKDAQRVYDALPEDAQPAFFQLVLHPATAGRILHEIYITAAKNELYAGQKRNAANAAIERARELFDEDADLTERWDELLDGKWERMLDQTHLGYDGYWQQPMRDTLPAMTYVQARRTALSGNVRVGIEASNASVPGDDKYHDNSGDTLTLPPMDRYGAQSRWFDVFSAGTAPDCEWKAFTENSSLRLSSTGGVVGTRHKDTRVTISVDWDSLPADAPDEMLGIINVTSPCRSWDKSKYGYGIDSIIEVPIDTRTVPDSFESGFIESDGHVSIEAPHFQSMVNSSSSRATYHVIRNYGRTLGGVEVWPLDLDKLKVDEAPMLEYDMYLLTNDTLANVTVFLSPSENYIGEDSPLEYAIDLSPAGDDVPDDPTSVRFVSPPFADSLPRLWNEAVADAVWGLNADTTTSSFQVGDPGHYTLRIWCLLPNVIVQKIVVDLGGVRESYLGPPESFLVGRDEVGKGDRTNFTHAL